MSKDRLALLIGAGSALTLAVLGIVGVLLGLPAFAFVQWASPSDALASIISSFVSPVVFAVIVGAGVWAALRWLLPVVDRMPLRRLVPPVLVATLAGTVVWAVISTIWGVIAGLQADGAFFGYAFPAISSNASGADILQIALNGLARAAAVLPVVALVALVVSWRRVLGVAPEQDAAADASRDR